MELHEYKWCWEDNINRWHHECLWIYQNTGTDRVTPSLQKLGRKGIFQHDDRNHTVSKEENSENYDLVPGNTGLSPSSKIKADVRSIEKNLYI